MKNRDFPLICVALIFFLGFCFMSVKKQATFQYPTPEQFSDIISRSGLTQWTLKDAGTELCSDPQAALDLQEQIQAGYRQVIAPEQYSGRMSWFSEWGAQRSGIYATARVVKQDAESQPIWDQLKFSGEAEYNNSPVPGQWELSESTMLGQSGSEKYKEGGRGVEQRKTYFLYGTLSRMEGAGDFRFRFSPSSSNLPANMSFYQKAVLTDEKGSLPVYIAPTALSQEELLCRRLHIVQAVQNSDHETCYVIMQSFLIE